MTKMFLTIISCVFLCVACSDADYNNDYYEQQIDELYNKVSAAENEIANLQTQLEDANKVIVTEEPNISGETNTTDIATRCTITQDWDYENNRYSAYTTVSVTLFAQLDDVLKWEYFSEDHCKDASTTCAQYIDVVGEMLYDVGDFPIHRKCVDWYCEDNDCTSTVIVYGSFNCDEYIIEAITQFYSATHRPCNYNLDELL